MAKKKASSSSKGRQKVAQQVEKPGRGEAKPKLLQVATELVRQNGYDATSVEQICAAAGVSKGAFFHHFESKEALVEEALQGWDAMACQFDDAGEFHQLPTAVDRLQGYFEQYIQLFKNPAMIHSCLAGTIAQEAARTHPSLGAAAGVCMVSAAERATQLIEDAARERESDVDAEPIARLWVATLQGSLVQSKACGDQADVAANIDQFRQFVLMRLGV